MIKIFTIFVFAAILISSTNTIAQSGRWIQKKSLYNLVAGRNYAVGFSIKGKGYIGTGYSYGFGYLGAWNNNDLWQYDTLTNSWTQMASMPLPGRQSATAFVINDKAYICGGFTSSNRPLNDLWQYDPNNNAWVQKASMPNGGLSSPLSFTLKNNGYVGFGFDSINNYQKGIWTYNPSNNHWTRKNDFPAKTIWESFARCDGNNAYVGLGLDPNTSKYVGDIWQYDEVTDTWTQKKDFTGAARFNEASFFVNNKLYIVGGENNKYKFINDCWVYNQTLDTWSSIGDFIGPPRGDAVSFTIGDKGYIGTGYDAETNAKELGDLWELNTTNLKWRQRAPLGGGPRDLAVGFNANGIGIIATGEDGTRFKKDVWAYTPEKDNWSRLTNLTYGKNAATGFSIGLKLYIGLGVVDTSHAIINPVTKSKDFWVFNPVSQAWTQIADFAGGVRAAAVSFVINGKAYVGTGYAENGVLNNDLWQYDPAQNSWNQKASLPGKKRSFAVAFVINGKGYVGMGGTAQNNLTDLYEYDASGNTWLTKASFPGKPRNYNVAVASGNKGYAGLGIDNKGTFLNDWWQFDPVQNAWNQQTDFPSARWGASALSAGNHIYVGMGVTYTGLIDTLFAINDWWEYLPVTEKANALSNVLSPEIQIGPNPFSNQFQLQIASNKEEVFQVLIEDETGKVSEEKTINSNKINYFGNSLPSGIFFVHVRNNSIELPVKKIIKQ